LQDVDPSTVALMQDCLTRVDGRLWSIVQMDLGLIKEDLKRFDLSRRVRHSARRIYESPGQVLAGASR
jgi:hypothetical protein